MVPDESQSEPKWDLRLETRRGKCNRASKEPKQAPLNAKMASQCLLRLTLPYAQVAQAVLRNAHPRLRIKQQQLRSKEGNGNCSC
jgi:hypothetical protein